MIKLERTQSWYRPYTVISSGTTYVLESIKFYDEEGNIVATSSGWLQNQGGSDIPCIDLNVDKVTRRNKVKFDGEVFGTVCHCSYNSEKRLNLYIPMSLVNLTYIGKKKMYGDRIYECYQGDQGIFVTKYVESLDRELREIKDAYTILCEKVSTFNMERHPDETIDALYDMMEMVKRFKIEKDNVDSYVVEG